MALVLFFDGDCGFCTRSVTHIYRLDTKGAVEFAPLQGNLAKDMGLGKFASKDGGTMVIVREPDGGRFFKGDAWIELGRTLGGVWAVLANIFSLFPKSARDWGYDLVAKNRYYLAGKSVSCAAPDPGLRRRMRE